MLIFVCLNVNNLIEMNGNGVSVIQNSNSYGGTSELYELAVLHNGRITYDTPITNDVLGHLTPDDVSKHMIEVQEL